MRDFGLAAITVPNDSYTHVDFVHPGVYVDFKLFTSVGALRASQGFLRCPHLKGVFV